MHDATAQQESVLHWMVSSCSKCDITLCCQWKVELSVNFFRQALAELVPWGMQVYGWPFNLTRKWQKLIKPYRTKWNAFWSSLYHKCTACCGKKQSAVPV